MKHAVHFKTNSDKRECEREEAHFGNEFARPQYPVRGNNLRSVVAINAACKDDVDPMSGPTKKASSIHPLTATDWVPHKLPLTVNDNHSITVA